MNFEFSADAARLRHRLRALIGEHVPSDFLGAFTNDPRDLATAQRFCGVLAEAGLLTTAWPTEYGGRASSVWEQTVVREEMWAFHEPRGAQYMGVNWVGPTIMRHGTPEQKAAHLPPIAAGQVIWCQGFSEPDAGSDLRSLRASAVATGDGGWRINGQKIWTSYAAMAQWCFLLARVDVATGRRDGITVFLVPMDTPGIEVRPIRSMLGPHHFNEVFLSDVEVGAGAVLGQAGQGWDVVREVLAFERVGIARYARCERLLQWAPRALGDRWDEVPEDLVERWAAALVRTRAVRLMSYKVIASQAGGQADPAEAAAYRIAATTLDQMVADVLMELAGPDALTGSAVTGSALTGSAAAVEDHWRYAQAATIASGSVEMQRNLIGRSFVPRG